MPVSAIYYCKDKQVIQTIVYKRQDQAMKRKDIVDEAIPLGRSNAKKLRYTKQVRFSSSA